MSQIVPVRTAAAGRGLDVGTSRSAPSFRIDPSRR